MKALPKTLTHLIAAGLGMALVISAPGLFSSQAKPTATTTGAPDADALATATRKTSLSPDGGRVAEFRRAWTALASRSMSNKQLIELQLALLEKWSEVDLQGALEAALAEPWDSEDELITHSARHPLGDAFAKAFAERPLEAWKILSSGKLGPGAQLLRRQWVTTVARKDSMLVASMLGELPPSLQEIAIFSAMTTANRATPAEREALLKKLASSGNPEQATRWLQMAYLVYSNQESSGVPSDLRSQWSSAPPGIDRIQAMTAWSFSLRAMDRDQFAKEWAQVPESDRGEAAKSILSQMRADSPAFLDAIDHVIEAGEWNSLEKSLSENLGESAQQDPKAFAEWALTLPPRAETTDLYHHAVTSYLAEDPDAGREWLESLPAGDWHRERGFAELSQVYLQQHNDPEGSRRAIDSITDPLAKRNATTWLYDWQLLTQKPAITRQ
ncbi:hypothetical protein [Luteolibacter soli]|uniref:Lytic murein transglycosylase n=1 Tax=Luteolibacter soli TaxID=3135280 RepID=A0ABU9AUW5_9BACT